MKRAAPERVPWAGWKLFSKRSKDGTHVCLVPVDTSGKLCGEVVKYSNTTTNFKNHLSLHHKAVWEELLKSVSDVESAEATLPTMTSPPLEAGQSSMLHFYDPLKASQISAANAYLVRRLERETVRFIAGDLRPFSAVEGPPHFTASSPYNDLFRRRLQGPGVDWPWAPAEASL